MADTKSCLFPPACLNEGSLERDRYLSQVVGDQSSDKSTFIIELEAGEQV